MSGKARSLARATDFREGGERALLHPLYLNSCSKRRDKGGVARFFLADEMRLNYYSDLCEDQQLQKKEKRKETGQTWCDLVLPTKTDASYLSCFEMTGRGEKEKTGRTLCVPRRPL